MNLEFIRQIFEKYQLPTFMKNPFTLGAEFFHAGGRTDGGTDRHEANNRFSQFCGRA
jgi:hypothetical protein